jgi:hypothetical protein
MLTLLSLALGSCLAVQQAAETPAAARSRAEWAALRDAKFAVPAGRTAFELLNEMNRLLGSSDPFLRDNVAYEAAARWIYTDAALTADEQRRILGMWTANLGAGLGEASGDAAFKRSFSALSLSVMAARENAAPFLTQEEFDRFLGDMLDYFARERDTRGFDATRGWIHAAAHTADVLKFLARSPKLTPAGQARILAAIDAKCAAFGQVFAWAEDERLAQVVASLARRPDFDRAGFEAWLASIGPRRAALWSAAPAIDPAKFPEVQNLKLVLRAAYVALSLDADPAPGAQASGALRTALRSLR